MTMSLLFAVTFGMTSAQMFYYTTIMKQLFGGATEVTNLEQFWTVKIPYL